MTLFSRFRSQPSGNTGGQKNILRLPCHDANSIEHTESKATNTDALPTHFMIYNERQKQPSATIIAPISLSTSSPRSSPLIDSRSTRKVLRIHAVNLRSCVQESLK